MSQKDSDIATYILLMLSVTFGDEKEDFVKYLVELWKYDLNLPMSQAFAYYDFRANERRTTFVSAFKRHKLKEVERKTIN
jgi:hypothetical protein